MGGIGGGITKGFARYDVLTCLTHEPNGTKKSIDDIFKERLLINL